MMRFWLKRGITGFLIVAGTITVVARAGEIVSMVGLLASPHDYVGQEIVVVGVIDTNRMRIYLTRDHAKANDFASSIGISDPSQDGLLIRSVELAGCVGRYVRVLGTFRDWKSVQITDFGLTDIKGVFDTESGRTCWETED